MTTPTLQQAYALASALVAAISARDGAAVRHLCGSSSAVADEIFADIDGYFALGSSLSLASLPAAPPAPGAQRPAIDSYLTHAGTRGLECVLFSDGKPGEAILHVEVSARDGALALHYKYIGS
ncbi:MAG: hypothetical protein RR376_06965 [Janthinobacterium sp.]|jgi:hypothetical protein